MSKLKILLTEAIKLSGSANKDFTEKELSNQSGLASDELLQIIKDPQIVNIFSISKMSRIRCSKCKGFIEMDTKLSYSFCSNCNTEINKDEEGIYSIGINREKATSFIVDDILKSFEVAGWKIRDCDEEFIIVKKESVVLALAINLKESGLKDYFSLRGWAIDYSPASFIVVSSNFDKFISTYGDKDPKCILLGVEQIFDKNFVSTITSLVESRIELYEKEKNAEKLIDLEFRKFGELPKLLDNLTDMLRLLPARALQKTPETSSRIGNKFQKDIVSLFNLTILRAKYAGSQNEPDGVGIIIKQAKEKSRWFPMEIKTFKPEDEKKPFYPLKEVVRQIEKYLNAFKSEEITAMVETPAFLAIAYDFDIESPEEQKILESFQSKQNIRLVLFPLKSIIKMVNNFLEKKIYFLPNDEIERFLLNNRYIKEEDIDQLFKELEKINKDQYLSQMKIIRKKTKEQGK